MKHVLSALLDHLAHLDLQDSLEFLGQLERTVAQETKDQLDSLELQENQEMLEYLVLTVTKEHVVKLDAMEFATFPGLQDRQEMQDNPVLRVHQVNADSQKKAQMVCQDLQDLLESRECRDQWEKPDSPEKTESPVSTELTARVLVVLWLSSRQL